MWILAGLSLEWSARGYYTTIQIACNPTFGNNENLSNIIDDEAVLRHIQQER